MPDILRTYDQIIVHTPVAVCPLRHAGAYPGAVGGEVTSIKQFPCINYRPAMSCLITRAAIASH